MSDVKLVNIARLMTTYNFEIEELPNNLKCAQCKLVLKDACQVPCGCRFCHICIDEIIEGGGELCPGGSEDCGESLLSRYTVDYVANKGVSRLAVKCPHNGCVHVYQLANMEEHLRECPRRTEKCPFRQLGCTQERLAAEEIGGHLLQAIHRHSEILIGMVANINREIEVLKQRDEVSSKEIEWLKHELVLKDGQIRSIMDQMIHMQNENKSIKEEKEDLTGRVRILSEQIEREIAERRENDELDSARVIDHVDREIAAVTGLIGSNKDKLATQLQSVRGDIGSINQDIQSMKDVKSQVQLIQGLVGLGQVVARFEWVIDVDVQKTKWLEHKQSEYFSGVVQPYKYRLTSWNSVVALGDSELWIQLRIYAGPNDGQLAWPFEARLVLTVTDRDNHEAHKTMSRQCRIEKPPNNNYRWSDPFMFQCSELIKIGLNLSHGVRVSCVIVPGVGH